MAGPSDVVGDSLDDYTRQTFTAAADKSAASPLGARAASGVKPSVRVFKVGDSIVTDINAIPNVIAAVPSALESGAEAGGRIIKDAILEIFESQGGPRGWAPNTAWTLKQKGNKPIMVNTGALLNALEIRRTSPVAPLGIPGQSAQRHIGWFDDLHPTATTENYLMTAPGTGGRRMTFGEVAWVNELGIQLQPSERKGEERQRHIPARPWASTAADLRGRAAVVAATEAVWSIISNAAIDPLVARRMVRSVGQASIARLVK